MGTYLLRTTAAIGSTAASPNSAEIDGQINGSKLLGVILEVPPSVNGLNGATPYNTYFHVIVNGAFYLPELSVDTSVVATGPWLSMSDFHNFVDAQFAIVNGTSARLEAYTTDGLYGHTIEITLITDSLSG